MAGTTIILVIVAIIIIYTYLNSNQPRIIPYNAYANATINQYIDGMVNAIFEQTSADELKRLIPSLYAKTELTNCNVIETVWFRPTIGYNLEDIFGNNYEYGMELCDVHNEKYSTKLGFHTEESF